MSNKSVALLGAGVILALLGACASSRSSAGLGVYTPAVRGVAGGSDGSAGWLAPLSYPLGAKTRFATKLPFVLALDYTPLAQKGPEGDGHRYALARALLGLGWGVAAGPSLVMHTIRGSGQVLELNNGNSTASFATPNSSVTSKTFALNVAHEYAFGRWALGNEIVWQGFLKTSRWNFGWLLSLHYQWGGSSASTSSSGKGAGA